ncbi:MAG: UbiD family decarboxylase, partial [Candidatus Asgardarchaeum californiense]
MLREFIAKLRKKGTLYEIKKTIPNDGILTAIMQKLDGKTTLIHNFKNFSSFKLISGLVGSRENIALALNTTTDKLYDSINKAMGRLKKPKKSGTSPSFMENRLVGDSLSLDILPIQRFFESDGGPYITSALVIAKDPEQEFQNISFHRLMKLDKNHFAIRLVPRHLYTIFEKYKKMGKDTPIAIVIGVHPAVLFAASYPLPYGSDELWLANAFLKNKLEVSYLEDVDAFVPSHAEIVMTGVIKHDILHEEGPFVDITGTRDIIRKQPVVEISEIYYRNDPYYYT